MKADIERNSEALNKLQGLPHQIEQMMMLLKGAQSTPTNERYSVENEEGASTPGFKLLEKLATSDQDLEEVVEADNDLLEVLKSTQQPTEYGPDINPDIASSIKELYEAESHKKSMEKLRETHLVPANMKHVEVPKVNKEIWPLLSARVRQRDFTHQQNQSSITVAAVATARIAETLFTTKCKMDHSLKTDLLKMALDVSTALAFATDEINKQRKADIRPSLTAESSNICNGKSDGSLLFGANLPEQLKASKSTAQIVKSSVARVEMRKSRPHPYRRETSYPLNSSGPFPRSRGTFRGQNRRQWRGPNRERFSRPRSHESQMER